MDLMTSEYRRGTVFGLTIAEIFILLLFLLLLIAYSYGKSESEPDASVADESALELTAVEESFSREEVQRLILMEEKEITELKAQIEEVQNDAIDQATMLKEQITQSEIEIQRLREEQAEQIQKLESDFRKEREQNSLKENELQQQLEKAQDDAFDQATMLKEQITQSEIEIQRLREEQAEQIRKLESDFQKEREQNSLKESVLGQQIENRSEGKLVESEDSVNVELMQKVEELEEQIQQERLAKKQLETDSKKEIDALHQELQKESVVRRQLSRDLFVRAKGSNPPCWYKVVKDNSGGERERPYYTFGVAVFDQTMVFRLQPTPKGGAADDNGRDYSEESAALNLRDLPYDVPLNNDSVISFFKPVSEKARLSQVRTYSCTFFVKVWDKTSPDAKGRWQKAHDGILESLFGTYIVRDEVW